MAATRVIHVKVTATLLVAVALSSTACSKASDAPADRHDGGPSDSPDTGAADPDPPLPPGLKLLWRIVESVAPGIPMQDAGLGASAALPPVAGARVCVYQRPDLPCVTSHAD